MKITKTHEIHLRVWPDRSKTGRRGAYYDIHIYPTKKGFEDALRKRDGTTRGSLRNVGATCRFIDTKGLRFGHVYFYHSQFFDGNVAHECAHIGIDYCRQKGIDPFKNLKSEEKLARAVGDCHMQIFNALRYKEGRTNDAL